MKALFSLNVMLIGMLIVFVGLILLILSIKLLSLVINGIEKRNAKPQTPANTSAPKNNTPAPTNNTSAIASASGVDSSVLAVIMAAVMAMQGSGKTLVIRSVRRLSDNWKNAGLRETLGI